MRKILFLLAFIPVWVFAQTNDFELNTSKAFSHLEIGGVVGTTGVGFDISAPLNKHLKLRAGFSCMPKISDTENYSMTAVGGSEKISLEHRTKRLAEYLGDLINNDDVDNIVAMDRRVGFSNAKLILDWYPFHKKNWHFSAGFYFGASKIGEIQNTLEEAPTMLAMIMYNDMYDQIQGLDEYEFPTFSLGKYSFELDPITGKEMKNAFKAYGRVAVQLGSFDDGTPHYIQPDANGILKAEAKANKFKPYVGFGFDGRIGREKRWDIGFDMGIMYWGTPHIYCNDGVCLVHDVHDIKGVVGRYIKVVKRIPVFPVLEFKLSYALF